MIKMSRTDRVTVCGLPGTGKTVLTRHLCTLLEPNLLIYDPLDQYRMFKDECRYVPKSDSLAEFDQVMQQVRGRQNLAFVIEESERYLGQGKPLLPATFDVVNRGRNWGIGIIAVTRRIQRISKDFFDLCQHIIIFKNGLKSKEYLRDMIGKQATQWVYSLEKYHFIDYNLENEEATDGVLEIEGVREHIETHLVTEGEAVEKEKEESKWQKEAQAGDTPSTMTR